MGLCMSIDNHYSCHESSLNASLINRMKKELPQKINDSTEAFDFAATVHNVKPRWRIYHRWIQESCYQMSSGACNHGKWMTSDSYRRYPAR